MKENWEYKKLGDVCKTGSGGTPLKGHKEYYDNGNIPWLRSGEVCQKDITESELCITEVGMNNSSAKLFPINTVLIAMYGATAGQVGILRFESTTNQAVCGIFPNEKIIPEFIYYFFTFYKDKLVAQAVGGAQPNISQIKIANTIIPLPPLDEQKRIVKILDEKFAQLETVKANAKANLQNAKDLLFAELTKTFEQESWKTMSLQDVCTRKITDGTHQTPKYCTQEEGGYPFISSKDVTKEYIDWTNIKYIVPELHEELYKRIAPQKDDVLLAKNGTTGVAAIVEDDKVFDIYVTLAVLRPNKEIVNPRYLLAIVNSPLCKEQFKAHLKGSGVPNLHLEEIQKVIIPVPPLNEQESVVKKIENLKLKVHEIEEIYTKQLANCDELKQAFLAKAFAGEL